MNAMFPPHESDEANQYSFNSVIEIGAVTRHMRTSQT